MTLRTPLPNTIRNTRQHKSSPTVQATGHQNLPPHPTCLPSCKPQEGAEDAQPDDGGLRPGQSAQIDFLGKSRPYMYLPRFYCSLPPQSAPPYFFSATDSCTNWHKSLKQQNQPIFLPGPGRRQLLPLLPRPAPRPRVVCPVPAPVCAALVFCSSRFSENAFLDVNPLEDSSLRVRSFSISRTCNQGEPSATHEQKRVMSSRTQHCAPQRTIDVERFVRPAQVRTTHFARLGAAV